MIPVLITIVCTIVGLIIFLFLWLHISTYLETKREDRYYKKESEHFKYVAERIKGCTYWLNNDRHTQFKIFFDYILKEMETRHHLSGEGLRGMVDEIQLNNNCKKND